MLRVRRSYQDGRIPAVSEPQSHADRDSGQSPVTGWAAGSEMTPIRDQTKMEPWTSWWAHLAVMTTAPSNSKA
ncbi:unnamed protein product [Tilletia caries]|nr:unnamed protein product [Tilletia caries]